MQGPSALAAGTRFGELEVLRVIGAGGFGIVYLARDHSLHRDVAIKEYMPAQLAGRGPGARVTLLSTASAETFATGLQGFVDEARLLANFSHPAMVKVYRFWKSNGTGYMAMPYLRGPTLADVRRSMSDPPIEAWMRSIVDPLLDALTMLHAEGVYHRDISPDNVLVTDAGAPMLLDFGAARRLIGERGPWSAAILKPRYSPVEQYAESAPLRQGPWTDLYALGALMAYLVDGRPPPASTARAVNDELVPLVNRQIPGVSSRYLAAIDWALAVQPQDRPQSVDELRRALDGRRTVPRRRTVGAGASTPAGAEVANEASTVALAYAPTVQLDPSEVVAAWSAATAVPSRWHGAAWPRRAMAAAGATAGLVIAAYFALGPLAPTVPAGDAVIAAASADRVDRLAPVAPVGQVAPVAPRAAAPGVIAAGLAPTGRSLAAASSPPAQPTLPTVLATVMPTSLPSTWPDGPAALPSPPQATSSTSATPAASTLSTPQSTPQSTAQSTAQSASFAAPVPTPLPARPAARQGSPMAKQAAPAARAVAAATRPRTPAPVRTAANAEAQKARTSRDLRRTVAAFNRAMTQASRHKPAATQADATGPLAACASRNIFMRPSCVQTQCKLTRFKLHSQCLELRQLARYRD